MQEIFSMHSISSCKEIGRNTTAFYILFFKVVREQINQMVYDSEWYSSHTARISVIDCLIQ